MTSQGKALWTCDPRSVGVTEGRPVGVYGVGLLCPAGIGVDGLGEGSPGSVPGFRARSFISDRKRIKLMTRAVQLGVAGANLAVSQASALLASTPPARRGMFVGASPQAGDESDLAPALQAAEADGQFSLEAFAREGIPAIHPLWLVRGLSNNVLGFSSGIHDLQGVNSSYCDGSQGGWTAVVSAVQAIAEGRVDVALAGASDCRVGADAVLGRPCSEGAAMLLLAPAQGPGEPLRPPGFDAASGSGLGDLGAAGLVVAFVRAMGLAGPATLDR